MSETNRSYRIKANVSEDTFVDVNLNQNIEVFEMLSLKISSDNFYKLHTAEYGCVAGRVLANGGVGIPNAKLSIFIAADDETKADAILSYLYPYSSSFSKNADGVRYNLLPEDKLTNCHQNIGTFPSKRLVLDDDNVLEIFDKYYKFTTTTNASGDYMIFGVPTGNQTLHMDLDISDIGELLSQRPRDLQYKGYNTTLFENSNMFKNDKSLDSLSQVFTQTESVYVYPFWGEKTEMGELNSNGVRITRKDIDVDYKFEPTCVFIGSLVTDEKSNGFTKRCIPTERMGKMDRLTTGEGTIEMIRKTTDGSIESYTILGNQLIDGNGTWCYQIPMNLDYVTTDEYGNIVPTDDPNKGVPTRARVRFRFSLADYESDYQNSHLVKVLVPNNPHGISADKDIDYVFGTNTSDNIEGTASFRDLFYNNVYTVKSYIPRLQHRNFDKEKRFSGIKAVNVNVGNNPIPYNNMRIDITFLFTLQCAIMHILIWLVTILNKVISGLYSIGKTLGSSCKKGMVDLFSSLNGCVTIGDGMCSDLEDWYFAPGCANNTFEIPIGTERKSWAARNLLPWNWFDGGDEEVVTGPRNPMEDALEVRTTEDHVSDASDGSSIESQNSEDANPCITNNMKHFIQCIEISLAQEYEVIQFDFYNDWMNGLLYIPRWFARVRKKRSFLFGLIKTKEKLQACVEGNIGYQRKYVQQCALSYSKNPTDGRYTTLKTANGCNERNVNKFKCHKKKGRKFRKIKAGYVRPENTSRDQTVYYFKPVTVAGTGYDAKEVKLFATDVILLGSLSERNTNGIPQAFKELVSSTYQMPTNIAATNLGHVGYMYSTKDGSYLCSGNKKKAIQESGITVVEQNFSNENKWINGLGYEEEYEGINSYSSEYEPEYAVTESAGIDWGYTGPGQAYSAKTKDGKTEIIEQNRSTLYQPGGHFLGISCTASEANVKSCVNLSRVCEIGVSISSRQHIPDRNGDGLSYNAFTIPTGVISRDEIIDDGFRSEFATMNFNGLETTVDPITRRRVYKFEIMNPRNFDGSFRKVSGEATSTTGYFNLTGTTEGDNVTKAYKRTIETNNVDYYDFRLGWHGSSDYELKKKYLIDNGGELSLPMYENSFYFYFGLHDGSTALDRFFKEFFAECPDMTEPKELIRVETTPIECDSGERGSITVHLIGFTDNVKFAIKRRNPDTDYITINGAIFHTVNMGTGSAIVENIPLGAGEYTIDVYMANGDTVVGSKDFTIAVVFPEDFSRFEFTSHDFEEEVIDIQPSAANDSYGYLKFEGLDGVKCAYVVNEGYYVKVKWDSGCPAPIGLTEKQGFLSGNKVYAWVGNAEYTVYASPARCSSGFQKIGTAYIRMPIKLDVQIGPYEGATYKSMKSIIDSNLTNWWKSVLNGGSTAENRWSVEKALTYNSPYSSASSGRISVLEEGGNPPYNRTVKGYGERISDGVVTVSGSEFQSKEDAYNSGYDLSETGFNVPTYNFEAAKGHYAIQFSDSENGSVESSIIPSETGFITFPSIYRPFHIKYIVFRNYVGNERRCNNSLTVYNGVPYNNKFKSITANGYVVAEQYRTRGTINWNNLSNREFSNLLYQWTTGTTGPNYSAIVEESAPAGYEGGTESIVRNVVLPADESKDLSFGTRFYKLYKRDSSGAISSDNEIAGPGPFNNVKLVPEGVFAAGSQKYKGSAERGAFIAYGDNGNRYIFEPGEQLDKNKILAGDMSEIDALDQTNTLIVAINDPWTNLSDNEYAASQNSALTYQYVNKDESSLSVISVYDKHSFMEAQNNPDVYPSQSEYKMFWFTHEVTITENGVDSIGEDTDYQIHHMGAFHVDNDSDAVSIPNIRVEAQMDGSSPFTDSRVVIFIVDSEGLRDISTDIEACATYYDQHKLFDRHYGGIYNGNDTSYQYGRSNSLFTAGEIRGDLNSNKNEFYIIALVDVRQMVTHLEAGRITFTTSAVNTSKIIVGSAN